MESNPLAPNGAVCWLFSVLACRRRFILCWRLYAVHVDTGKHFVSIIRRGLTKPAVATLSEKLVDPAVSKFEILEIVLHRRD
jgi:hypothetical protein